MEKWVKSSVAGDYLDKDPDWLTDNAQRLNIPHGFAGRHYRFKLSELDSWMKENSANAGMSEILKKASED
jgi:hypothetical protein